MKNINEKRIDPALRLTNNQKTVMSTIIIATTPKTAADDISVGRKMVTARDALRKLGLIKVRGGRASITKDGMDVLRDSNIIDSSGNLTAEGKKHAYVELTESSFALLQEINNNISE